jgi:UDP-N-acetylglucosamine acyltransferase
MTKAAIHGVRTADRVLFFGEGDFRGRIDKVEAEFGGNAQVARIIAFIRAGKRPLTMAIKRSETDEDS